MNGKVRFLQRFKCKKCGYNFVIGDKREKLSPAARSLAILLYGRGKASYGFIAKLFKISSVGVMKLIKREADKMPAPVIDDSIKEVSFDEMWHFVEQKKTSYGCHVLKKVDRFNIKFFL
jgi:transposase